MRKALLLIDYINEIVHKDGKLAAKGYADFMEKQQTFHHLAFVIDKARQQQMLIIHVRVGFSPDYHEQPKASPLFGKANEFQILQLGSWSTQFHEQVDVQEQDIIITKHRVNAFHATPLDLILKNQQISELIIAGVSTDLAVSNASRDAHDKDYQVTVLADCCAAPSEEEHHAALLSLNKIATIQTSKELFR